MTQKGTDVQKAAKILKNGGIVAIPTETVYGLAANAYNDDAIARVFEVKNRPSFDPLIVHSHSIESVTEFITGMDPLLEKLAEKFWPGPITLLLNRKNIIPDLVTSGMNRVAVRLPDHQITINLLKSLDFPLVAPSANPFGYVSPTTANHVISKLGNRIDYVLDGGNCSIGIESTIVGIDDNRPVIYRLGGLDIHAIEEVVGKVEIKPHGSSNPSVPGMLQSHYSPSKKVILGNIEELRKAYSNENYGVIHFSGENVKVLNERVLSPSGNIREAAKNLFSVLRSMDESEVSIILAEPAPGKGLGLAINDRLKRAAT